MDPPGHRGLPRRGRPLMKALQYRSYRALIGEVKQKGPASGTWARRLPRNPARGVPLPRLAQSEPVFLTHEQVAGLAEAAGSCGPLITLMAYTGLRWGEVSALRVRDVDLARRRLDVRRAFTEVEGRLVEGTPKSHQRRSVPLPRLICHEIELVVAGHAPDALSSPVLVGQRSETGTSGATCSSRPWRRPVWMV
jgi:integrase